MPNSYATRNARFFSVNPPSPPKCRRAMLFADKFRRDLGTSSDPRIRNQICAIQTDSSRRLNNAKWDAAGMTEADIGRGMRSC